MKEELATIQEDIKDLESRLKNLRRREDALKKKIASAFPDLTGKYVEISNAFGKHWMKVLEVTYDNTVTYDNPLSAESGCYVKGVEVTCVLTALFLNYIVECNGRLFLQYNSPSTTWKEISEEEFMEKYQYATNYINNKLNTKDA